MPATPSVALTDAQLAGYAKGAGFSGTGLVLAVAVALAETRGHPTATAHNPTPPDNSYGPWQINMYGTLGPARRKQFGLSSNEDLFNVATNAKAAYAISSKGKNFAPWSTYLDGKYLAYMSRARKAAGNPDSSGDNAGGGIVQASNPFSFPGEVIDFFEFISDPITWMRAGMLIAGAGLLLFALAGISGMSGNIAQAANTVTDILPQTRGIKAAAKVV